jgi:hypothetical protein
MDAIPGFIWILQKMLILKYIQRNIILVPIETTIMANQLLIQLHINQTQLL